MNKYTERLYNGLIKENPTFVLMLGMCPTLAVTTSAINGIGMGLSTTVVLVLSNMLISMLRKIIPDSVRTGPAPGICSQPVCFAGTLYPIDRSKLYHPGPGGELRFQESGASVHLRRDRNGARLYGGPDGDRHRA